VKKSVFDDQRLFVQKHFWMRRPPTTVSALLHKWRPLLTFPPFIRPSIQIQHPLRREFRPGRHKNKWESKSAKKRALKRGIPKHPPIKVFLFNPRLCSGCGIPLQNEDNRKPGFIYRKKDADRDRALAWKKKNFDDIYNAVLEEADETIAAKLANTNESLHQMKFREAREEAEKNEVCPEQRPQPTSLPEVKPSSIPPRDPLSNQPNVCRRCHEITYHSNPLPHTTGKYLAPQSIEFILNNIHQTNKDLENPPLIIHVIDVVDFPLCFIPFNPPWKAKVLFVINRADSMCERASKMGFFRPYFQREISLALSKAGISQEKVITEVHPVSAKKGYGIPALLKRIFELRNAESNIYFIGTYVLEYEDNR
jgi:hypothetical protein